MTANQIDASELKVKAANITGTLEANQINMTGAITWNDLSTEVQNSIEETDLPTYITKTHIEGAKIVSPTIEANEFNVYPSDDGEPSFNLYGRYDEKEFHFLEINYSDYDFPMIHFSSPSSAGASWDFSQDVSFTSTATISFGMGAIIDFDGANIQNLSVTAKFG